MANTNYIDSFEVNGVEIPVRDPGISQWAREPSAPEYTAENREHGAPGGSSAPVTMGNLGRNCPPPPGISRVPDSRE